MKTFVNFFKKENGLSLVELLAVISVSSLVLGLIYSVTIFGMNTYKKIEIEGQMREEADIIMSSIFQQLYVTGAGEIEQGKDSTGAYSDTIITLKKTNQYGGVVDSLNLILEESGLRIDDDNDINDGFVELATSSIILSSSSDSGNGSSIKIGCSAGSMKCSHGMISIELLLKSKTSDDILKLESKFGF